MESAQRTSCGLHYVDFAFSWISKNDAIGLWYIDTLGQAPSVGDESTFMTDKLPQ
jgi:hypothetical protein